MIQWCIDVFGREKCSVNVYNVIKYVQSGKDVYRLSEMCVKCGLIEDLILCVHYNVFSQKRETCILPVRLHVNGVLGTENAYF